VELRKKSVVQAPHQVRGGGEEKSGYGNRKQQNQRQQVVGELLNAHRAAIATAPPHGHEDSDKNHHCTNIKDVEGQRGNHAVQRETTDMDSEHECPIDPLIVGSGFESNPAE
jgi:hypothetical protein